MIDTEMKIISTDQLKEIVRRSEKTGLSNLPSEECLGRLDPKGKHVLNPMPLFGERFVRTFAMAKLKMSQSPAEFFLDIDFHEWKKIPKGGE